MSATLQSSYKRDETLVTLDLQIKNVYGEGIGDGIMETIEVQVRNYFWSSHYFKVAEEIAFIVMAISNYPFCVCVSFVGICEESSLPPSCSPSSLNKSMAVDE